MIFKISAKIKDFAIRKNVLRYIKYESLLLAFRNG